MNDNNICEIVVAFRDLNTDTRSHLCADTTSTAYALFCYRTNQKNLIKCPNCPLWFGEDNIVKAVYEK